MRRMERGDSRHDRGEKGNSGQKILKKMIEDKTSYCYIYTLLFVEENLHSLFYPLFFKEK